VSDQVAHPYKTSKTGAASPFRNLQYGVIINFVKRQVYLYCAVLQLTINRTTKLKCIGLLSAVWMECLMRFFLLYFLISNSITQANIQSYCSWFATPSQMPTTTRM
jgi:hypothetical protein